MTELQDIGLNKDIGLNQDIGLNYIGADELVFNNDKELGIYSGGFSVKSIMMKAGMSPIMTLNYRNTQQYMGGTSEPEKVSDLFNDLVVPNWALSYNDRIVGGKYNEEDHHKNHTYDEDDDEDDDETVTDKLHDKLLDLVKEHNAKVDHDNQKDVKEDNQMNKNGVQVKKMSHEKKIRVTRRKRLNGGNRKITRKYRK
jgi:hypothetical protein